MTDEFSKLYEAPPNDHYARADLSSVPTCDADCKLCRSDRMVSRRLRNETLYGVLLTAAGLLAVFAVARYYA